MSQLSYSVLDFSIREHITVLLWYVAVVENRVNLEVLKAGTVNNLIMTYHDMVTSSCTSSDHANQYNFIPFKFPISTEMKTESVIGNIILN